MRVNGRKIGLVLLFLGHIVVSVNQGFVWYFCRHFQYGTTINGKDVSGLTVKAAETLLSSPEKEYQLTLKERDGEETISAEEIEFDYDFGKQVKEIKLKQYPYAWMKGLWSKEVHEIEIEKTYDEKRLEGVCDQLGCLNEEKMVEPENAGLELVNGQYEIIEGHPGSVIIEDQFITAVKEAINEEQECLSLEETGCYKEATITTEDEGLKAKREALNHYVSSVITYDFGDRQEVIDGELISQWISIDEQNVVTLDEEKVLSYIGIVADTYDTLGGERTFRTSAGNHITIKGGDYGWQIDRQAEGEALIEMLKKGNQHIAKTPAYLQEARCREKDDIGNSYVEINLTKQYLWFYKNGKLITEGSIVSGTGTNEHATPAGTYNVDYKKANAILRGPGYACPVSYWIPFNSGIGIHDATWRGTFGGSIYMYNGSHGCINTPLTMAKAIFAEIESGMPVVCYHEAY